MDRRTGPYGRARVTTEMMPSSRHVPNLRLGELVAGETHRSVRTNRRVIGCLSLGGSLVAETTSQDVR